MKQPAKYGFFLIVFLVLLRLAIGWHFFMEGAEKVRADLYGDETGASPINKTWSGAPFLRLSQGPMRDFFRQLGQDPDRQLLAWVKVDASKGSGKEVLSEQLKEDWNNYTERFVEYYGIKDEAVASAATKADEGKHQGTAQRKLVELKRDQAMEQAAKWLTGKDEDATYFVEIPLDNRIVEKVETVPARIDRYRALLRQIEEIESEESFVFDAPVNRSLSQLKAEAAQLRNSLTTDLWDILKERLVSTLSADQLAEGRNKAESEPLREVEPSTMLWWSDKILTWGIAILGGLLILGLFTRLAAVLGALFLASVYIVLPALPWVEALRAEGTYVFVNKNTIEMLALLALACTPSGRWVGLDGLVRLMNPFRRKPKEEEPKR